MASNILIFSGVDTLPATPKIVSLMHPATGSPTLFVVAGETLLELQLASMPERSFFVDDTVVSDGSVYTATQFDPNFLVLPILAKSMCVNLTDDGRFCQIQQSLDGLNLPFSILISDIQAICDVKEVDEDLYYRLSKPKILAWLQEKMRRVQAHCFNDAGSLWREEDKIVFCAAIVAENLDALWTEFMLKSYGLTIADLNPKKKRSQTDLETTAVDASPASSRSSAATPASSTAKKPKTATPKAAKIDPKGMKQLSSFFTVKPK